MFSWSYHYDGSSDLDNHFQNYKTAMRLHEKIMPLMRMAFSRTLRKVVNECFNNLPRGLITLFIRIVQSVCRKQEANEELWLLLSVSQKNEAKLWEDIQCFNAKRLKVGSCSDDVVMAGFTTSLKRRKNKELVWSYCRTLIESIMKEFWKFSNLIFFVLFFSFFVFEWPLKCLLYSFIFPILQLFFATSISCLTHSIWYVNCLEFVISFIFRQCNWFFI